MAENKATAHPSKEPNKSDSMFSRENYIWMLGGLVLIAIGIFIMAGGKSEDPNVFNKEEVYSNSRLVVAPIIILAGLVVEVFAIFRKPRG
jgi:hypothetical protein